MILRLTDANHRFQVSLEGQALIDQTLSILAEENLLLIDAQARRDQIEWRLSGFRVRRLPDAIPDDREEHFSLRLRNLQQLPRLHQLLSQVEVGETESGASRVTLKVDFPQGLAEIDLVGRQYRINLETRRALAAIPSLSVHVKLDNEYMRAMHHMIDGDYTP